MNTTAIVGSGLVVDTTELRWFFDGRPSKDVVSWFTRDGTAGVVEKRCDAYLMDDRSDVGVKRRFRETLELKIRRRVGERLVLTEGPAGRLEQWTKWSPADDQIAGTADTPWLEVHKTVIKRRFSSNGEEIALSEETREMIGAGCDVEVTTVVVRRIEAWTFAFAAFGPTAGRRQAIVASWDSLCPGESRPEELARLSGRGSGYPEWLRLIDGRFMVTGAAR